MEKEFIPYSEALALKELGFDELCFGWYAHNGVYTGYSIKNSTMDELNMIKNSCSTPLYQQAFRWFREKHKMQAEILWRGDMSCFCYKTGRFKYGEHTFSKDDYKTYEEAELECLLKLIEIIKEKQ